MTDHRYDLMTPRFPRLMEAHSWATSAKAPGSAASSA